MTKVTIELELDEASYRAEYGPGSEHWAKYVTKRVLDGGHNQYGPTYHNVPKADSEYKSLEGEELRQVIVGIMTEGFHDYLIDDRGWLNMAIDGKALRHCCHTIEGDKHKRYCPVIAGPEATE